MFKREQQARASITAAVLACRINGDFYSPFFENGLFFLHNQNIAKCRRIYTSALKSIALARDCAAEHEGQKVSNAARCISIASPAGIILPRINSHKRTGWNTRTSETRNNLFTMQFPVDARTDHRARISVNSRDRAERGDALDLSHFDLGDNRAAR